MQTKDWIELIVPIAANGVFLYIFHLVLSKKIEKLDKRQSLRDEVVRNFLEKSQLFNDKFVLMLTEGKKNPNTIPDNLLILYDILVESIKFFDTNKYDLNIFEKEFDELQKSWNDFQTNYSYYSGMDNFNSLEIQHKLDTLLQKIKDNNQSLINAIRKKY